MKKISLFFLSLLCLFLCIKSVFAESLISQWYTTKSLCENARSENNKLFPKYERWACTKKTDQKYYYEICTSTACFSTSNTNNQTQTSAPLSNNVKAFLKWIEEKTANMSEKQKIAYKQKVDKSINNLLEKYKDNPAKKKFIEQLKTHSDNAFKKTFIIKETHNEVKTNNEQESNEIVQGLYRATKKKYSYKQMQYENVCKNEFWSKWIKDNWATADPKIMITARLGIEVWDKSKSNLSKCYTYAPGYTSNNVQCESKYNVACIVDSATKVVDEKYRLTWGKYKWVSLIKEDLCKVEYGNEWKIVKDDKKAIQKLVHSYPEEDFWLTIPWYYRHLSNITHFYYDKNGWGGSEYKMNIKEYNKYNQYGKVSRKIPAARDNIKLRFACEKDDYNEKDPTKMVQWLYKGTSKKYTYGEASKSSIDLCKKEYGYLWKTEKKSIDANIMLQSKNSLKTWILWWNWTCTYYDGKKTLSNCQQKLSLACTRDNTWNQNENYTKYLEEVSWDLESFYQQVERDTKSKIMEKWDFIYFNNKFALSKKQYYWNQIYSGRKCKDGTKNCWNGEEITWVCPAWYKIAHEEWLENEAELIWYYFSQNYHKYNKVWNKWKTGFNINMWRWEKYDHRYATTASLDKIKKHSMENNFRTTVIRMSNPYLGWNPNKTDFTHKEKTTFMSFSGYGSSSPIWIKQPVLCITKNKNLIDVSKRTYETTQVAISKSIKNVNEQIVMNNKESVYGHTFFYWYHKAKATWFFDNSKKYGVVDQVFYKPILKKWNGSYHYLFFKKQIKWKQ